MEHQDIVQLISAGKLAEAKVLLETRRSKRGISGQDLQELQALFAGAPAPVEEDEPAAPESEEPSKSERAPRRARGGRTR